MDSAPSNDGATAEAVGTRRCPTKCPCICHDTWGSGHDHEGRPCPGKLAQGSAPWICLSAHEHPTFSTAKACDDEWLARNEIDLSICPYFKGEGSCMGACSTEPSCITDRPLNGWPSERATSG